MKYTIKKLSAFAVVLLAAIGVNASLIINTTAPAKNSPLSAAEAGGGFTAIKNNEMRGQTFLMPATGVSGSSQWSMTALTLRTADKAYAYEAGDQLELFVFAWNPSTDGNDVTEWSKGDGTSDGDPLDGTGMSLLFSQRYDLPTTSVAVGSYLHFNLETPVVLSENTTYGFAINLKDAADGTVNNTMRLATGGDPNNVYSDGRLLITTSTANNNNADADMTFYVTTTATERKRFEIITVDPAPAQGDATSRLVGGDEALAPVVWDWTSDDLLGWSGSGISGLSATGGALAGTGTTPSPYIQLTGFSGPDLDFGFYDYLQTRLRLPAGFGGEVIFRFGTSTERGTISADREFRIPNAQLIHDGEWHTYRIDLGLIPRYRDQLTDLLVYPLGVYGRDATFEIDYIEIGDKPGDLLLVNTNISRPPEVPLADVRSQSSKHATIWWAEGSGITEVHRRRALRMIEESYQVYTKILGYLDPFESWDLWRRDGKRYKVNQTTWYGGFWMGGHLGFGYFNVPAVGLGDEGWGNPVPHEFAHVVQGHQINFLVGGHWESHANYLRQAWQMHYAYRFPVGRQAQMSLNPLINSNYRQDHGSLIYADFRIHHALESTTDIGLDWNLAARLWYEGQKDTTCYTTLAEILPSGYNMADVLTRGLRRWPFLDFEHGDKLRDQHWRTANDKAWHNYITGSLLIPSQDRPGWWRVPFARAPERFAYMYHELDPSSSTVTVELQGVDVMGTSEGWRWSLAAVDGSGSVRYSDVFPPGTQSMTLQPGETKVYLIVVATPADNGLNLEWADNRLPTDRHLDRLRYPYEVRIVGATPAKRQLDWNTTAGSIHPNGGGWKANTATVHSTAYVGPNARVLGSAQVLNNARIEDYAVVAENAIVSDNAVVSGYAVVRGRARVRNNARLRDRAVATENVQVLDDAVMTEYALPGGNLSVMDDAIVRGQATAWAGTISGQAILDYDVSTGNNFTNGVQFASVPWGGWYVDYWWMTKAKPRGLVASYRVDEPQGQILWDEFGVAHGLLRGNAQRVSDARMFTQVMRLDGTTAYLVLDRNLAAMRSATYSLWVKPDGANTDRAVLFMGGAADRYLRVVPRDVNGRARVRITRDGTATEWISQSVVPEGTWTQLAISFDADTGQGTLYVNGQAENLCATSLLPEDVLGPNDYVDGEALYVGRDWNGELFAGDVVDLRVFNVALSDQEIETSFLRSGSCIGAFFTDTPMNFDGSTTEFQSGVIDGLERALKATIYPRSSAANDYYEALFDSSDEVNGAYIGSGFGLRNGRIYVRLANVGFWDTGVDAAMNQWQTVMLTYNGSQAKLYIDGVERASRTYSANESHVAGKNFRIGFAQSLSSGNPKYYFNGEIRDAFIYDQVDVALQSAPSVPSSIVYPASSDTGRYTVEWASVEGATIYRLDRSQDGGETWTQVYYGAATSCGAFVGSGSYRYRVQAENISGRSTWRMGETECAVTLSVMENWLRQQFEYPGDEELAGWLVDPDADGVVNLMEFALRGDPRDGRSREFLPSAGRAPGGNFLYRFRVRHMDGRFAGDSYVADGLLYQILRSPGLGTGEWDLHPFTEEDITWAVDADETPVLEVEVDREEPRATGFFKLRVGL